MIVWGGDDNSDLDTGGRYFPDTDTWLPTGMGPGPTGRRQHTAVWTVAEMIVWGGRGGSDRNDGSRYDPALDAWTPTSLGAGVPMARRQHTAVWTGREMIVWGGANADTRLSTGGRYDPALNVWTPTSMTGFTPVGRTYHTAVWSGSRMLVWGGATTQDVNSSAINTGGRYDPQTDSWSPTNSGPTAPSARWWHSAVWSNDRMIVWGGDLGSFTLKT